MTARPFSTNAERTFVFSHARSALTLWQVGQFAAAS